MMSEQDETMLSQLADGELTGDETADVLLRVIDDAAGRQTLKRLLHLRLASAAWRRQSPPTPVMVVQHVKASGHPGRLARLAGLAAAACVGAALVLVGVWTADHRSAGGAGGRSDTLAATPAVTPEQMDQVASVFALHESVAGPLAWYAAGDQAIRTAAADGAGSDNQPIAVLLKLIPASRGETVRTFVIVCREREDAVINLPDGAAGTSNLRVYLAPRTSNGTVDMQYAIAMDGPQRDGVAAALSGRRHIGLKKTSLGQLALDDRMLNVEATAWPIKESRN
jgi:hypothetical protein